MGFAQPDLVVWPFIVAVMVATAIPFIDRLVKRREEPPPIQSDLGP